MTMPFYSQNLKRILEVDHNNLDEEVNLSELAKSVAKIFGDKVPLATSLLANASGQMRRGTVDLHLIDTLNCDSVVRDILTTGHLAKLLSRLEVFRKTSDYRIVGMPNQLFDAISQAERAKFFERGNILEIDGELLDLPDVRAMMDREAKIFQKFSSGA